MTMTPKPAPDHVVTSKLLVFLDLNTEFTSKIRTQAQKPAPKPDVDKTQKQRSVLSPD